MPVSESVSETISMDDQQILARLAELGVELPPPPKAVASYIPVRVSGKLAFVAGQVAMIDGVVMHAGRVGEAPGDRSRLNRPPRPLGKRRCRPFPPFVRPWARSSRWPASRT